MIGHADAEFIERLDDLRHGGGGFVGVDGDAHQLRAGIGQRHHLIDGRLDVGGIGIGHRLHDDRVRAADFDRTDTDGNRTAPRICCHIHIL